jgi:hypothetical protein
MADNQKAPRDRFSLDEILAEARLLKAEAHTQIEDLGEQEPEEPTAPAHLFSQKQADAAPKGSSESKKKKGLSSLFQRRRRRTEIPELEEDDIYYGLQLKTLKDYEKVIQVDTSSRTQKDSMFSYLFDTSDDKVIDQEISEQFNRLHDERVQRIQNIMKQSGIDSNDIFSDYAVQKPSGQRPAAVNAAKSPPAEEPPHPAPKTPPATVPLSPAPDPSVQPRPEIDPSPVSSPEIREPISEPLFIPEPVSIPDSPGYSPEIRCSETEEPLKEPVVTHPVKEEIPPLPTVREPYQKQNTQSVKNAAQGYRAATGIPIHLIALNDFQNLLSCAAADFPVPAPKQPPAPIPIPRREETFSAAQNHDNPLKPTDNIPHTIELTREFQALRSEISVESEPLAFPQPKWSENEEYEEEDAPVEEASAQKTPQTHFSLFGSEEEENDSVDNLPNEPEELDDYSNPSDSPSIFHDLHSGIRELYLRLAVTSILTVILLILGFLGEKSALLPALIQVGIPTQTYLILNLIFLLLASVFSAKTIANGFKGLFLFQANSDSAVAVAVAAVLIQSIALLFVPQSVESETLHVYAPLVAIALFLNTAGKLGMMKRIEKNFRFVAAPEEKHSVQLFDDHNTALQMAGDSVMDAPVLVYQTKTNFLKNFLHLSYEPDPSDQSALFFAPIGFVCSLVLCIVTLYLSKDAFNAITAFTAASCIFVPFVNMLSVNMPVNRVSKIATRCGGMVVGFAAVDQFSATNAVIVDAKDLFPKGTVILNGIKTFGGQRIDDAIVDATALMCAAGGPLSDLFDQIIKSRRDMLPKIDNLTYEDDKGVTGWVSGRRILVGNRCLMEAHQIEPPSRDYEDKYIHSGKKVVYLASGGDLVAMFIVFYSSDRRRAMELRRMEDNGISLIARTCDPNITPRFLADCFGLDEHSVRVLPERLGSIYEEITESPLESSPALIATKGRPTAMMRLLTACVRQRSNISIALALQNVAVVLGFLLVAFLTCYSGLQQLTTGALLIYEMFWICAILLVPRIRKP